MGDEEEYALDYGKVAAAALVVVGLISGGVWLFISSRNTVASEPAKDYKKLFSARSAAPIAVPAPVPVLPPEPAVAAQSSLGMLKIDDNMRAQPPAARLAAAPAPEPPLEAPAPEPVLTQARPAAPAKKSFAPPRLNTAAYSSLNGGAGIVMSGGGRLSGGAAPSVSTAAAK